MNKNRKVLFLFLIFAGIICILVGVTYSFFNYTRTGLANNFRVGRIYFNTSQNGSINLSNVFPITSEELGTDVGNHDSVTVTITGDTTYSEGIEYLVTLDQVNNTVNGKTIPIIFNTEVTGVGTSDDEYYDNRGGDSSIYMLYEAGDFREDKYLLAGYIAPGETGINGSITLTAYVNADKMAITDTYSLPAEYIQNPNMTLEIVNSCVSILTRYWGEERENYTIGYGETYESFCNGTGTSWGQTFYDYLYEEYFSDSIINDFIEMGVLVNKNPYNGDTTDEWVNGRVVFTTNEWNSLKNDNALSFKIKVEANEGIWVEEEATPGRCFTFSKPVHVYKYNDNMTPSELNACISFFSSYSFDSNESAESYCSGTGTLNGVKMQDNLNREWFYSNEIC